MRHLPLLLATLVAAAPAAAQQRPQADTEFSVDVEWMGASVGYARAAGPGRYRGVAAGVGGAFFGRMLAAGDRFSHRSEGSGEGAVDTRLVELVHLAAFQRWAPSEHMTWDVGARASVLYNSGPFDDDPAFPVFAGAYASLLVGGRRVKVGPRVLLGLFAEGSGAREVGLYLAPVVGRIAVRW